jgi:hypothetical protein
LSSVGLSLQKTRYGYALAPAGSINALRLSLEPQRAMSKEIAYWRIGHELCLARKKTRMPIGTALTKDEAIKVALRYLAYLRGELTRDEVMLRAA